MDTLRRISVPCGIVGSLYSILLSVFAYMAAATWKSTSTIVMDEKGQVISSVPVDVHYSDSLLLGIVTGITALMGILGLITILSLKRKPGLLKWLTWISIGFILTFGMLGIGFAILPGVVLLIVAATSMQSLRDDTAPY